MRFYFKRALVLAFMALALMGQHAQAFSSSSSNSNSNDNNNKEASKKGYLSWWKDVNFDNLLTEAGQEGEMQSQGWFGRLEKEAAAAAAAAREEEDAIVEQEQQQQLYNVQEEEAVKKYRGAGNTRPTSSPTTGSNTNTSKTQDHGHDDVFPFEYVNLKPWSSSKEDGDDKRAAGKKAGDDDEHYDDDGSSSTYITRIPG